MYLIVLESISRDAFVTCETTQPAPLGPKIPLGGPCGAGNAPLNPLLCSWPLTKHVQKSKLEVKQLKAPNLTLPISHSWAFKREHQLGNYAVSNSSWLSALGNAAILLSQRWMCQGVQSLLLLWVIKWVPAPRGRGGSWRCGCSRKGLGSSSCSVALAAALCCLRSWVGARP